MNRLVIDTETTGLSPRLNKTLTVGLLLVSFKPKKINILNSDHIFIRHDHYNANPFALKINKINLEQHHKIGIPANKACQKINNFILENSLQQTPLLGHNINFDKNFLSSLFQESDCTPLFHHESEDTMWIWKSLQKQSIIPPSLKANLRTVSNYLNINYEKAHDALADCHITAQVYHKMLKML